MKKIVYTRKGEVAINRPSANIIKSGFVKSAANFTHVMELDGRPEVAFVGRSNVGKSSLLNMLCNQRALAITSKTPGRTRLINFFDITIRKGEKGQGDTTERIYFVDLPGYGYAEASKQVTDGWNDNIGEYLLKSRYLQIVFVLLDIRHAPSDLDISMLNFLQANSIPFAIIATKADKFSRAQGSTAKQKLAQSLGVTRNDIIVSSSLGKVGRDEIVSYIAGRMNI